MGRFMAHVYAGDPDMQCTKEVIRRLEKHIDILELGIPYSDPIADGKVFQAACARALSSGTTPEDVFAFLDDLDFSKEIVLTTYYNIVFSMGEKDFVDRIRDKVSGLIVPDLPMEESGSLHGICKASGIDLIYIVAPTTPAIRIEKIVKRASGFIYLVSVTGVTGSEKKGHDSLKSAISVIKSVKDIPILIGFGISSPEDIQSFSSLGVDGYIIGSEICRKYMKDIDSVDGFAEQIRESISRVG